MPYSGRWPILFDYREATDAGSDETVASLAEGARAVV